MKPKRLFVAWGLAFALAGTGCDPVGRGVVRVPVPEAQIETTVHPTHNIYWHGGSGREAALGPEASGSFQCVALADFDGDRLPDIAAGASDPRGVHVWLSNGDGTWSGIEGPAFLGKPQGLAAGDVNGDGRPDLVIAGRGEVPGVRVWVNVGELHWKEAEPATITQDYLTVKLVDINRDKRPDIVATRQTSSAGRGGIAVWLNAGGKGWSRDVGPKAADQTYRDVAVADFNGDGHLDLVAARWGVPGHLDIWYGNSRGAWERAKEDPATELSFQGVDTGDFNGDGHVDIVATAYRSDPSVCLFLNDGRGGWWSPPVVLARRGTFWDAKAVDLNGDGLLDVAATSFGGRGVRVWLQLPRRKGRLAPRFLEQSFRFPHKGTYFGIEAGDFNTDERPELVAASGTEGVKVWFQVPRAGAGLIVSPFRRKVPASAAFPRRPRETDETPQDPSENQAYITLTRDDGRTYSEYRIGTGDVVRVEIYPGRTADPKIIERKVAPSGELLIPLAGRKPIRIVDKNGKGLSPSQLRQIIADKLKQTFRDPIVVVTVSKYTARRVSILGEIRLKVNQSRTGPGNYVIRGKTRVLDFIARHGGFTDRADLTKVEIRRRNGEKRVVNLFKAIFQSKLSQDVVLDDGDVVTIPAIAMGEHKVHVLGEVGRPGLFALKDKVRLLEAIQMAGSFTRRANRKQILVIRGDPRKPDVYKINLLEMLKTGDLSKNLLLADGDIVFVPRDWIGDVQEFYSWFLGGYRTATGR